MLRLAILAVGAQLVHAADEQDLTRTERVFPFEVGQQYEFQAAVTYHRPNGDSLLPRTVATITVSDTAINGKTWLYIPYWSPFGSEYYRLEDTLVWNVWPETGEERRLLNLGDGEHTYDEETAGVPGGLDRPFLWAYEGVHSYLGWVFRHDQRSVRQVWEWSDFDRDSSDWVLVQHSEGPQELAPHFKDYYGIAGNGGSGQLGPRDVYYGVFRPVSPDKWPGMTDYFAFPEALPPVDEVFPFEVGQQYEFQSAFSYRRPNGELLPRRTIATITVSDTVIDGKTWLHVPYWSSWGSEYYRLGDSLRVWTYWPDIRQERILYDLTEDFYIQPYMKDTLRTPRHWGYGHTWSPRVDAAYIAEYTDIWTIWADTPWTLRYKVDVYHYSVFLLFDAPIVRDMYGLTTMGAVYHMSYVERTHGVFRRPGDEPWPNMTDLLSVEEHTQIPRSGRVAAAPNPFNAVVTLRYTIPTAGEASVTVFDLSGRVVRRLWSGRRKSGRYTVGWDGTDENRRAAASGVYFVRLVTPERIVTSRISLLR